MTLSIETINFHGLEAYRLNGPRGSSAIVSRLGGQVLSWITPDGRERLFLSERAVFDGSMPIRGGIPVCFPQFANLGSLPKHGFLRTRHWALGAQRCGESYALLTLTAEDDAETRALWPHAFRVELTVMLEADRIDLELCVVNTGDQPFAFTGALHTYLRTVQVEDVALEGLYGHRYLDALKGGESIRDSGMAVSPEAEIDRVYRDVHRPLLLSAGNLSLGIQNQDFPDVVLWNPWVERCRQLPDMAPEGWRHMLCVEAAIATTPLSVAPGEEWYGRQTLVSV